MAVTVLALRDITHIFNQQAQQRGSDLSAGSGVRRLERRGRAEDALPPERGRQPAGQARPNPAARRRHERDRRHLGGASEARGRRSESVCAK